MKIGDTVNYHSIIGGEITSKDHTIKDIVKQPNNFGCDVAWITNKSGCVSLEALSNKSSPMKKPLSKRRKKSKENYQKYLKSELDISFAEYMGFAK